MLSILKEWRGNSKVIVDSGDDERNLRIKNFDDGSVELVIYHPWNGNFSTVIVEIPPQHLRELRDSCNLALDTITGYQHKTEVTVK